MELVDFLGDDWLDKGDRAGYGWRRVRLAGQRLAASAYELPPGEKTFPYHYEVGNEELLVVLSGRPTLRDPEGERELAPGDCILFKQGPEGAHQLQNRSEEPARVLIVANQAMPRTVFYPDSGKVRIRFGSGPGDVLDFRQRDAVDYWDGE